MWEEVLGGGAACVSDQRTCCSVPGSAGCGRSPSLVRGPRGEELPLAIPELPLERELKLEEPPTTPGSAPSQLSKATPTRQSQMTEEFEFSQHLFPHLFPHLLPQREPPLMIM